MSYRDRAVDMLEHYFAVAMGLHSANELGSDQRTEIASIVDLIIQAAKA